MKPTRIRDLVIVAVIVLVLVHLLVWFNYDSLPRMPIIAGLVLLAIAIIDVLLAIAFRPRFERRKGTTPVAAVTALRVLAAAKASAILGALMLGAWAGLLAYLLPSEGRSDVIGHDVTSSVVGGLCAVALAAAGLWLEHCCRVPKGPDDDAEQDQKR
ncbi:DUF3180 domain-containing protein [Sciscionella marina]|uniref:DUF3180 domain-containing protein n=1 Tax=Sciscionella marina TaxID=508770 RepID=UPI000379DBF5|nr:DUF3180 domain-containing protein [Sciscionella marina]